MGPYLVDVRAAAVAHEVLFTNVTVLVVECAHMAARCKL